MNRQQFPAGAGFANANPTASEAMRAMRTGSPLVQAVERLASRNNGRRKAANAISRPRAGKSHP